MKRGAIILCGGQSRRMRRAKADLPFGSETMLARVVRLVREAVDEVVVVAAIEQTLTALGDDVEIVRDERPERGPLEGLAAGLRALAARADLVYATSCDVPLLAPAFVRRMFELVGEHDAAAPRTETHAHPLAAVYRLQVQSVIKTMLAADRLRLTDLLTEIDTRYVTAAEFADVDPHAHSLRNVNRPEEYAAALAVAGLARGSEPSDGA